MTRPSPSRPLLRVDLDAVAENWRALDAASGPAETAAVVKADAYGTGAARVAPVLREAGARTFFVALPHEGAALREILGPGPAIYVFNGLTPDARALFADAELRPVLNSPAQIQTARGAGLTCGLHVESGINRLGLTQREIETLPPGLSGLRIDLVISHLASADDPASPMNAAQLARFRDMVDRMSDVFPHARLSLAATGGILLGPDYRFDLVRPGVGLYGGLPFAAARPVVHLSAPILQIREVAAGESVGYGATWTATAPARIGVLPLGYADGVLRALQPGMLVYPSDTPAPVVGRVSMDMLTIDLSAHPEAREGDPVEILGLRQNVDTLAKSAGTIGYEVLTSLGLRYERRYTGSGHS